MIDLLTDRLSTLLLKVHDLNENRAAKERVTALEQNMASQPYMLALRVVMGQLCARMEKHCKRFLCRRWLHYLPSKGPLATVLLGQDYYHRSSVDELVDKITRAVRPGQAPQRAVRISKAVNRLGIAERNPWPVIFEAIINRQIPVWRVEGRLTALMTSLAVPELGALQCLMISSRSWDEEADEILMTQSEAACFLGTCVPNVIGLIDATLTERVLATRSRRLGLPIGDELPWTLAVATPEEADCRIAAQADRTMSGSAHDTVGG
ncbi:hypothetical protein [Mesorhizobium sp.]|uniref:hypothetical protein n=1 Tax=Mesorhizobium sp. TaxID=1871066 RepID=UPI002579834B|nr:hypothetical protein [Mesorhizobium sp.]